MLEHVQISDTGNGRLHEGAVHSSFVEGAKHVHLLAATNISQGGTWIFGAPVVVGIDLTTNIKRALINEKLCSLEISYRLVSDETFAYRIP
jgi:hypothetical protein